MPKTYLSTLILFIATASTLLAQRAAGDSLSTAFSFPDTAKFRYFGIDDPGHTKIFSDTSLDNHFHQYSPTRKRNDEYVGLGYNGSAARPILRKTTERMGFDLGFHQFDVYLLKIRDFRFFSGNKSFSQGKWTLRSMGNDSNLDFEYGGHFKKNIYFSLNWNRVNSSSTGNYKLLNQSALNSCWGAALMQLNKSSSWSLGFSSNGFQQSDNGGLLNDVALRTRDTLLIGGKQSLPTRFSQALTNSFTNRNFEWQYSRNLAGSWNSSKKFRLIHRANLMFDRYKAYAKFNNRTTAQELTDSLFLGNLLSDSRGVRLLLESQILENRISFSGSSGTDFSKENRFETGILHRYALVSDERLTERFQNMFAFAQFGFAPIGKIKLYGYLHLGLIQENAGEYKAEGDIFFDLGIPGTLEARLIQQRYQPTFLQKRMVNAQREIWTNDFQKTFETTLSAAWTLKKLGFRTEAGYHLLNNYIFFNSNFKPEQVRPAIGIFQLSLSENLRIKHFGSDHFMALQRSSDARIHLPLLTGKHSLYFEGSMFRKKAMLARIGVELRYSSAYQADAYHPLIGQFYWQDNNTLPFFPSADVFLSAKIKSSRVFVKMENINRSWDRRTVFYQTPYYPQYDTYFRIGIQRIFTD